MKVLEDGGEILTLQLSRDELSVLSAGLLSTLDLLTHPDAERDLQLDLEREFRNRVGLSRQAAYTLIQQVVGVLRGGPEPGEHQA